MKIRWVYPATIVFFFTAIASYGSYTHNVDVTQFYMGFWFAVIVMICWTNEEKTI